MEWVENWKSNIKYIYDFEQPATSCLASSIFFSHSLFLFRVFGVTECHLNKIHIYCSIAEAVQLINICIVSIGDEIC